MNNAIGGAFLEPDICTKLKSVRDFCNEDDEVAQRISVLPSVVVGKILSYLPWKDKLSAGAAVPTWSEHLHSPDAWLWFCMDDVYSSDMLPINQLNKVIEMTRWCIRHYGRFFQNCVIGLCCLGTDEAGFGLVDDISRHCTNVKMLRIYHTSRTQFGNQEELDKYVACINRMVTNCLALRYLAVCNLEYIPMNRGNGVMELFQPLVCTLTASSVTELEFFHLHEPVRPVIQLASFVNLRKLKCPIQTVNTGIILALKKLQHLFLIRKLNADFDGVGGIFHEFQELKWTVISTASPALVVHYLFRTAWLDKTMIVPNPLAHTLTLGKDCQIICDTAELINTIVESYGSSLRCFIQLCDSIDEHCELPMLYTMLVNGCSHLHTFLVSVTIPAAVISLVAANRRLNNLWVEDGKISFKFQPTLENLRCHGSLEDLEYVDWWERSVASIDSLQQQLSKFLGFSWHPLTSQEMSAKVRMLTQF